MKMNQSKNILATLALTPSFFATAASDDDGMVTIEEAVKVGVPEKGAKR